MAKVDFGLSASGGGGGGTFDIDALPSVGSAAAANPLAISVAGTESQIAKSDFLSDYATVLYVDGTLASLQASIPPLAPRNVNIMAAAVTVVANASINTYGAWTQLVASTAAIYDGLVVSVASIAGSGVATGAVLSIGIGAAAAEVEQFYFAAGSAVLNAAGITIYYVPIRIPASSRIAARLQGIVVSQNSVIQVAGIETSFPASATSVDVLGVSLATSRGVNMPANNTYVEITPATARAYRALAVIPSGSGTIMTAESSIYTVGLGAAAAEIDIGNIVVRSGSSESVGLDNTQYGNMIVQHVPAGTRIACKQSVGRAYRDVTIIGVPYA